MEKNLESLGYQVWYDPELTGGQNWWNKILDTIRECDLFIFVLSKESLASTPCKLEYQYAFDLNKRILPIRIDQDIHDSLLPSELQKIQFVDYIKRNAASWRAINRAIINLPDVQSPPNPLPPVPDVPVSPLGRIRETISAPQISPETQKSLVFDLKPFLNTGLRWEAISVLQQLRDHPNANARIAEDIQETLTLFSKLEIRRKIRLIFGFITAIIVVTLLALIFLNNLDENSNPASLTNTQTPTEEEVAIGFDPVEKNADWQVIRWNFDGVDMVLVPSGCFLMGDDNGSLEQQPAYRICFERPFWIDKTEVTNGQYGSSGYWSGDQRPRETILWSEAVTYCANRGGRLPTEAEWEYAARGPDNLIYPWGNDFVAENTVYLENSNAQTSDVGSRQSGVSWVGALDMSGNVWEWTSSIFTFYPYDIADGRENMQNLEKRRTLRGGAWDIGIYAQQSTFRYGGLMNEAYNYWGFRCVRPY
ncbi:MAG: SUMF1/EgtB/PvdO family nonheme iron enzyme [Anaerolineae bacterium]|nr:SUMF1/EgtB/PvdO family nonheme iron enzyme [Anaerolineae bacterium]